MQAQAHTVPFDGGFLERGDVGLDMRTRMKIQCRVKAEKFGQVNGLFMRNGDAPSIGGDRCED